MLYKNKLNNKEFYCRQCSTFLDTKDLKEGNCPECGSIEDLFYNEGNGINIYAELIEYENKMEKEKQEILDTVKKKYRRNCSMILYPT